MAFLDKKESKKIVHEFSNKAAEIAMLSIGAPVMRLVLTQPLVEIGELVQSIPAYRSALEEGFKDFDKEYRAVIREEDPYRDMPTPKQGVCKKCGIELEPIKPTPETVAYHMEKHKKALALVSEVQAKCDHLKENGKSRVVGFITSDNIRHFICNLCFKQWTDSEVPAFLHPPMECIGGLSV